MFASLTETYTELCSSMPQRNRPDLPHRQEQSKKNASGRLGESRLESTRSVPEVALHGELLPIVQEHPGRRSRRLGRSAAKTGGYHRPFGLAGGRATTSRTGSFEQQLDLPRIPVFNGIRFPCDPYCGDAHRRALSAGSAVNYKCHAGLQCFTMPVHIGGEQNLAAIGGRAFVNAEDYRNLVERFRAARVKRSTSQRAVRKM